MENKLIWTTVQKRVDDLIPQKINPRSINKRQLEDLKRSLEKYNLVEIPAVDLDGTILAGHQRVKILKILGRGREFIDTRIPNRKLTKEESKGYLIGSNALGGEWDFSLLKEFKTDLLIESGFSEHDISNIWDNNLHVNQDENFSLEKELKKIKKPRVKLGDVISLGKHKLICGDANDPEVVKNFLEIKKHQ